MPRTSVHSFQNLQSLSAAAVTRTMRCVSSDPGQSDSSVVADLLSLAEVWKQLIASMHTYKFACLEAGDSEGFDLLDAIQRRVSADLEQLNDAIRRRRAATGSVCNPPP